MRNKLLASLVVVVMAFATAPVFAADSVAAGGISVVVDNETVDFDAPPFIEKGRTLVPLRAIAEAAGMKVDYSDATRTITLTKTETLLKLPLDSSAPYTDGKTRVITLTLGSDAAVVDGVRKQLDTPARLVGNRTFVPLRFLAETMDMDTIWLPARSIILISTRLRGSAPLAGAAVFPAMDRKTISIADSAGNRVSLGMDVTEMQQALGAPAFAWGRGVPAPQIRYEYGDGVKDITDLGKGYAEIGCSLGKVTVIELYSSSASRFKTGAGIGVGQTVDDIAKAYALDKESLKARTRSVSETEELLALSFVGEAAFQTGDNPANITHSIEFHLVGGKIDSLAINDIVTLNALSNQAGTQ